MVRSIILLLVLPLCSLAQTIKLPPEVKGDVGTFIRVPAETAEKEVRWYSPDKLALFPVDLLKDSKTAIVAATVKGRYRLIAWTAKGDVPSLPAECVVVIGDVPPGPGPVPPGPDPPIPPDPGPSPIPGAGMKVLIVYETADLPKMPAAQSVALRAKVVWDYLDAKCVAGPDGKTKQWRIWDKDVDTRNESKLWQDAFARKRASVPWIVIGTERAGYEGPLPENTDKVLELLKKYGG